MNKAQYKIGQVAEMTGLSVDTLRYYEKIGLLPGVNRTAGGARRYSDTDLAGLRFIQRAQKMNFSLNEIHELLMLRQSPLQACDQVRHIAEHKLAEITAHLEELNILRKEIELLVKQCKKTNPKSCAFLSGIEKSKN